MRNKTKLFLSLFYFCFCIACKPSTYFYVSSFIFFCFIKIILIWNGITRTQYVFSAGGDVVNIWSTTY